MAREGRPLAPKKAPGKRSKIDEHGRLLLQANLKKCPAATLPERCKFLERIVGVEVSESTVCRLLKRLGWSRKKDPWVRERDEWLRAAWRAMICTLDAKRLVFVDECGTHAYLASLYAWTPRGKRAYSKVPRNRKNTTLLASMTLEGMGPCLAVIGSTAREVLGLYRTGALASAQAQSSRW